MSVQQTQMGVNRYAETLQDPIPAAVKQGQQNMLWLALIISSTQTQIQTQNII